jgi:hypothetical protein
VRSPRAIDPAKALLIVELRRRQMIQSRIDRSVGVSASTVSRVLARAGLSKLSDLAPAKQVVRYEHERPGDLLHIDTKKRGRIVRASHRLSGSLRDSVDSAGWEMLFVVVDDHARFAFTAMHPDEKTPQAVRSLHDAVAYFAGLGVMVSRVLSDNGAAFCSRGLRQRRHRARHPAQVHPRLPTTDQWQGRTVHPVSATRMGLRLNLPELPPANSRSGQLAAPLQPAPPSR